jgi:hypothetical protein
MIIIEKWAGLATNAGQYSLPPGAAVTQVNLQVLTPGQLTVRPGMNAVSFASSESATLPIIASFRQSRGVEIVLFQDSAGRVLSAGGPT